MKKIFLLFFALTFLASCDDGLLEPFTPGSLTDDVALSSSADLQRVMNSTYNLLTDRTDVVFTSLFTDEVGIGYANGGQGISGDYIFFLNANSASPDFMWSTCYYALSRANRVIEFADVIQPFGATPAALDEDVQVIARLKAEALTIRALCHIRIMSYFSTDPKNDGALAGILANRVINPGETLPRSTNGEFYAQIHSDLNAAIAIYNTNTATAYPAGTGTYYASSNLAKAMKARAYALKGDYPNAEIWANDVIATSGIALANTTEYTKIFWTENEANNTEVIFRLRRTNQQNSQATNLHNGYCSVRPNLAGSPLFEISRSLFNILNPGNLEGATQLATISDVRARTIIAPSSDVDPGYATSIDFRNTDRIIINKHGGTATGTATWATTATNGNNNSHKLARISEMYFIRAEARVAAGDLAGAASALEIIMDVRNTVDQPTPVFANATQAWAEILNQRRLEFAYEGYRFIDLKRLGVLAGVGLDRDPADYSSSSSNYPAGDPANLPLNSFKFTLPIPLSETTANPSAQQNPGY